MFKKAYNRAVLDLKVETVTPLLIRAGDPGLEPAPDLSCVRTRHAKFGPTVYIPGSSLKGVVRSAAEATVRGEMFGGREGACDPLDKQGCGWRIQKESKDWPSHRIHQEHCLACRIFGSTAIKGRASVRDLYPIAPGAEAPDRNFEVANQTEGRHGVAINRISGAAQRGALYDMEVVPAGSIFWGDIALENYQVWQLGLLAVALDELNQGFAQLGSTKSRGLGVVRVQITRLVHEQSSPEEVPTPKGVGALVDAQTKEDYGLFDESELGTAQGRRRGLSWRVELKQGDEIEAWMRAAEDGLGALR